MLGLLWYLLGSPEVYAGGLRTPFGKVTLKNIPPGDTYSMRSDAKFPMVIENTSDRKVQLQLDILAPEEEEVQEGYEPIPDVNWIKLEKDSFSLTAGKKAETDVTISVPDDSKYHGRKFHVFIWSHTIGESIGVGLKSKLLFSVANVKEGSE